MRESAPVETWKSEWWEVEPDPDLDVSMQLFDVYQAPPWIAVQSDGTPPANWPEVYTHVAEVRAHNLEHVMQRFCNPENPWWTAPGVAVFAAVYPDGYWPEDAEIDLRYRALWPGDVVVALDAPTWQPYAFQGVESGRFLPLFT
ncbi:MAG: hypothetical protein KDB23_02475 [Planctomycetales bacterium]|nr:hypothetical protein [Planctomycetales bacterium]